VENTDWMNVIPVTLAIVVFIGAMLMMFTSFWTGKGKK
jgi:isopenicillin N synthase-like dioxygenase